VDLKWNMGDLMAKNYEFDFPPHRKVRVVVTVDRELCQEMGLIHSRKSSELKMWIALSLI
jgi:hypothetical protein